MFKAIKRMAAILLIVCLFLPLSQCTQQPRPTDPAPKEIVYTRYAIDVCPFVQLSYCPEMIVGEAVKKDRWMNLLFGLPFILPFLMVLFNFKVKQEKLRYELIEVILGLLVGLVVSLHVITGGKLLFGAYLAMISAGTYLIASLAEAASTIKERFKQTQ